MGEHGLDALIGSGNEYSGFEGAVTYVSGFQIVHRYAYVVIPADGDPFIVFPTEARYVGEHGATPLEVFHAPPGEHIAAHAQRRVEARRRLRPDAPWPCATTRPSTPDPGCRRRVDLACAVKSEPRSNGARLGADQPARLRLWHEAYAPGKTAAGHGLSEEWFIAEGCGRLTMNMVLTGTDSYARPEFKIARSDEKGSAPVARGSRPRHALGRRAVRAETPAVGRDEADA
jgi:hypothetical protein